MTVLFADMAFTLHKSRVLVSCSNEFAADFTKTAPLLAAACFETWERIVLMLVFIG